MTVAEKLSREQKIAYLNELMNVVERSRAVYSDSLKRARNAMPEDLSEVRFWRVQVEDSAVIQRWLAAQKSLEQKE